MRGAVARFLGEFSSLVFIILMGGQFLPGILSHGDCQFVEYGFPATDTQESYKGKRV